MKNRKKTRALAWALALTLVAGMLPATAFAAEQDGFSVAQDEGVEQGDPVTPPDEGAEPGDPSTLQNLTADTRDSCADGLDLTNVEQDKEYTDGKNGTATWDYSARTLTLVDVTIKNTNGHGICYDSGALKVVVQGNCSVTGTKTGILGGLGLTVEVGTDASLTARGGSDGFSAGLGAGYSSSGDLAASSSDGIALKVTVEAGGRLTARGKDGIRNGATGDFNTVTLQNNGTLLALGDAYGVNSRTSAVTLSGSGATLCAGGDRGYGVLSGAGITVNAGVRGLAAGGNGGLHSENDPVTNNASATFSEITAAFPQATLDALASIQSRETLDALIDILTAGGDLGTIESKGDTDNHLDLSSAPATATYLYPGGGMAHWDQAGRTLTLVDVTITTKENTYGIWLPAGATLVAKGTCSVTGGGSQGGYDAIRSYTDMQSHGDLTVTVEPGASLTATGGNSTGQGGTYAGSGVFAYNGDLRLQVGKGASLTVLGGESEDIRYGAHADGALTVENQGLFTAAGGIGLHANTVLTMEGTGVTFCAEQLSAGNEVKLTQGRLVCAGTISANLDKGDVTIENGVTGLIAGGILGTLTDHSNGGVMIVPMTFGKSPQIVPCSDPAAALDLSKQALPTLYLYEKGALVWNPDHGAKLATIGAGSDRFSLTGALTLPTSEPVELVMAAGTGIGKVTGGALSFFTPHQADANQPTVAGIDAQSVTFRGGRFGVSGTVTGAVAFAENVGQVTFTGNPALTGALTITPPTGHHARLKAGAGATQESDTALTYSGADSPVIAGIATGKATPTPTPTPPPTPTPTPTPGGGSSDSDSSSPSATEQATAKVEKAKDGDTVEVDLPPNGKLDNKVIEAAAGKDITLEISAGNGVIWVINGLDIPAGKLSDLNLKVDTKANTIPVTVINTVTGEQKVMQLALSHNGDFPFPLTLRLDAGKENAGLFANLYYFNETKNALEYQTTAQIGADGNTDIPFAHASSYAVVIDEKSHAPEMPQWENPFTDVRERDWFYSAVQYVHENKLMTGMNNNTFAPGGAVTRAQLWTVLARLGGENTNGGNPWYAPAQSWVVARGVSDGTNPDKAVTREQLVTMLYRYAQSADMDVSVGENTNILSYDDALNVSEWAVPAFQWACGAGIVSGTSETELSPQTGATRAQFAAILMRFSSGTVLSRTGGLAN